MSQGEGGQVSETQDLAATDPETPIQPDQAVAGAPDGESGEPDEGTAGPNARPRDNSPGAEPPD
jgi:hypothetical protein